MAAAATLILQEQEVLEHSAEFESGEEEEVARSEKSSSTQPSLELEAAHKLHRMLSSVSTTAMWSPPSLDDSLWAEDDDDEGFSGWTPWTPASFKMAEDQTSGTPSTMPEGVSSQ